MKVLNFSYKLLISKELIEKDANGCLLGLGKIILDGTATLGITNSEFVEWRLKHLKFLTPTIAYRFGLLRFFKNPLLKDEASRGRP